MKKLISILAASFIFHISFAQQNAAESIPQKVKESFSEKFPSANVKNLEKINDGYTAEFFLEKRKYVSFYNVDGGWVKTERKIKSLNQLPQKVKTNFYKSEYAGWRINELKEIDSHEGKIYFLHVDNANHMAAEKPHTFKEHIFLYFNNTGELIKKENSTAH